MALVAMMFAVAGSACLEVEDPDQPVEAEELTSTYDDPEELDPLAAEPSPEAAALAPECGDGEYIWKDWVCVHGQGWKFLIVGRLETNCAYPYFEEMEGRTARCKISQQATCGGGDPEECTYSAGCNVPRPTSFCFTLPPPPPPPPIG